MKQLIFKMARCVLPCACLWACAAQGFTVDGSIGTQTGRSKWRFSAFGFCAAGVTLAN